MHQASAEDRFQGLSSKLVAPHFNPTDHLERGFVGATLSDLGVPARHLLVDAQAGQGKTTFAAQLIRNIRAPTCWYQLGPEDRDPVYFLEVLLYCLSRGLPGFGSPLLEKMIAAGEVSGQEAEHYAALLLDDLKRHLRSPAVLVFDDVHRIEGATATAALLRCLLERAPARLRFILLSRLPIEPALGANIAPERILRFGNADLAFTHAEVAELFNAVLGVAVSPAEVKALRAATEGWAMGLKLAVRQVASDPEGGLAEFLSGGRRHTPAYFASEVVGSFNGPLRTALLRLSLLEEIPVPLADQIADVPDVANLLSSLALRNFFVRSVDEKGSLFVLHHLFQEALAGQATVELSEREAEEVFRRAGQWYLSAGRTRLALRYYLASRDYGEAERILARRGPELRGRNRVATLRSALEGLKEDVLAAHPWLSFYHAVAWFDTDPPGALQHLQRARQGFSAAGEEIGELLALAELIWFHIAVDAVYNEVHPLLGPAERLFLRRAEELDVPVRTNIANNLALGFAITQGDPAKADRHSSQALRWVTESGLESLHAGTRSARGYQFLAAGDPAASRREIEAALPLLGSPRVATTYRAGVHLVQVNVLSYEGDFANYGRHRNAFVRATGEDLVAKGVFGPWIRLWDATEAFGTGHFEEAEDLLVQALHSEHTGASPHFRSQFLQYAAYVWAAGGRTEQALCAAEESLRLREQVGSEYFGALTDLLVGGTHARLERWSEGFQLLDRAIRRLERTGEACVRSAAHGHRAWGRMRAGRFDEALPDVSAALAILKKGSHTYAYGWCPEVFLPVLSAAVRYGIEPEYARKIAAERLDAALLSDGTPIPLLTVRALGPIALAAGGRPILTAKELTPSQRQLLALLIGSPGLQRSQEEVQAALWPEGEPEKARASFDALLSRLRRALDAALGAPHSRYYLVLRKGVLSLENAVTDVLQFEGLTKRGLQHEKRGEAWQAANALWRAQALWQGEFADGIDLDERGAEIRHALGALYRRGAEKLGVILIDQGDVEEALAVSERALSRDRVNPSLVRMVYDIHVRQRDAVKAQYVVKRYEAELAREGYSPQEVQALLEDFWHLSL